MTARRAAFAWLWFVVPVVAIAVSLTGRPFARASWESPVAAFVIIVTVTGLCLIGAIAVLIVGWRHQLAEISILGAALATASVLPLAHGLTLPGLLYGANSAVMVTAFVAVPLAVLAAAPLLAPATRVSRMLARSWRVWSVGATITGCAIAAAFLIDPNIVPAPTPRSPLALTAIAVSLAGTLVLASRQIRLYRIGRHPASLVAAVGLTYLGLSSLVWLGTAPYTLAWWLAHAADAIGVLGAVAGLLIAHRRDGRIVPTLAPVVNRDPLVALELGLTPVVRHFVAALSQKDRVTRDHVVRVAELAMRAGVRHGLGANRLRALGIGALLHDVGKLTVPDEVLTKPGALTDDEFELMKQHTVWGEALLAPWRMLAPAAPFVRWHHERADGRGYPDGITASQMPTEAALISVCDAWDAMTSDRPYRAGMDDAAALAILRDGAGTQWLPHAVTLVMTELRENGRVAVSAFDHVGDDELADAGRLGNNLVCVCIDALPEAALLRR